MMPERHEYLIHPMATDERCKNWGCPELAGFEAVYAFQHEGEVGITIHRWLYCYRHAQSFAQIHGRDFPYTPSAQPPRPPVSEDREEPISPPMFRRLWNGPRPPGFRRRLS
jgi:hypothetical protein